MSTRRRVSVENRAGVIDYGHKTTMEAKDRRSRSTFRNQPYQNMTQQDQKKLVRQYTDWVKQDGMRLGDLQRFARRKPEIIEAAVTQNGLALKFVEFEDQYEDLVILAVRQNPLALEFARPHFHMIYEIVIPALRQNGLVLEFAPEMQDIAEIVTIALQQNGLALEFASPDLRKNRDIVLIAVKQHGGALDFAMPPASQDPDVVKEANMQLFTRMQQGK